MRNEIEKITISDIARELNITAATVSRALNDHPGIKDSTKKAVKETARKLNYQPNKIASSLRLGRSKIIGVIIPSAEINFFGSVVHGIEKVANENNYNVLIYQSNEHIEFEKKGVKTFLQSRVDGVLASISKETINLDHYREIIPVVLRKSQAYPRTGIRCMRLSGRSKAGRYRCMTTRWKQVQPDRKSRLPGCFSSCITVLLFRRSAPVSS